MSVESKIREIIHKNGYITIDEMMRQTLSENPDSYYRSTENIGKYGDFITAPEISQLFGEIIALWAIEKWQELGSPSEFILLELGPGQGQLMQDFLRIAKLVPDFFNGSKLYLLEINPHFMAKQKSKLDEYNKNIQWIRDISEIPQLPSIIISNEFFDALPIKQYIKSDDKWFESVLIIDEGDNSIKYSKIELDDSLNHRLSFDHINAQNGAIIEESTDSIYIIQSLSTHLNSYKGTCLTIDYGYDLDPKTRAHTQYTSSLQALKDHKYQNIMENLGRADLTAHVDFNALKQNFIDSNEYLYYQREFLLKYGIELRVQLLQKNASNKDQDILKRQLERLISPKHMGELFKVLEVCYYKN